MRFSPAGALPVGKYALLPATALAFAVLFTAAPASANIRVWDVDPAASYVRLTIPDFSLDVPGLGNVPIRLRNFGNSSAWVDAGGRRARLDGTIKTNYQDGAQIWYKGGEHNLFALEEHNARPNPAAFDPGATNDSNPDGQYTNTSTAMAAFASRVRTQVLFHLDVAQIAIRDVLLEIASGGFIALDGGGSHAGSMSDFGIDSAAIDADGLAILGQQPLPDILGLEIGGIVSDNTGGANVTNMGGNLRRLTYTVNVPVSIPVDDQISINGSATGVIVAYTTIPEPSSIVMAAFGALGVAYSAYRRRRRAA